MTRSGRILIADDEETFLSATADLLRLEGYECDTASDSHTAREMLARHTYDLLIADIRMPGNAELEFIEMLPQLVAGLPVILVTGYPSIDSAIQSVRLPVVAYLVKPLDLNQLLAEIQHGIERFRIYHSIYSSQQRIQQWQQELEGVEESMRIMPGDAGSVPVDAFLTLTLRNIAGSLEDLRHLTEALARHGGEQYVCQLFNCPRSNTLTAAIEETIGVLEKTKSSFKSKELGQLRQKLEMLVRKETDRTTG